MTNQEENKFQSVSPNSTTQAPILLAAKKNKQNNSNQDSNQVTPDPDRYKQKSSKQLCQNLLNDVDALLNGGGKEVNNPNDYKIMGRSLLPDGEPAIKTSIAKRIQDLKDDFKNLYNNKPEGKDSYKGHQDFVKAQQTALQKALTNLKTKCKNFTAEEQALIDRAEEAVKIPIPQKPDSETRQNSATASESKTIKQVINSIPLMSQEQKDATRKALESTGVPKIIKDSVNGGKEYWEQTGKQQLKDALDGLVKTGVILGTIAVFILEFVGKTVTGQLVSNPQDTTENPVIASGLTGTTAASDNTNPVTANPGSTNNQEVVASANQKSAQIPQPGTTTGQNGLTSSNTESTNSLTGKDTAFIISPTATASIGKNTAFIISSATASTALTGGSTALTGTTSTALTGGQSQKPQLPPQPELAA